MVFIVGDTHQHPQHKLTLAADTQTGMNPSRMFNITSEPSPQLNNREFSVGIGCAVGGSSCVNGQVFLRGTKEEYDAWKELGGPDSTWDWEGLLPYFKKVRHEE